MNRITTWYLALNIYLKLLPFLILYVLISIIFVSDDFKGDEGRYLFFANNLLNGFYSPPYPNINLWNGPGYPLLLAPLLFFKVPLLGIRMINGILLYLALIINYKTINIYSSKKPAFLYTLFLGLYFPIFEMLPLILTESLAWFLVSLTVYLFLINFRHKSISWNLILLSACSISFLTMVKVIFGYVVLISLIISMAILLLPGFRSLARKTALIFAFSLLFCLPYLFYTFQLTNKIFYWTNSASMSLYTMSTPFSNELGEWKEMNVLRQFPNHKILIDSISKLKPLEQDEMFKSAAINNIKNYPGKYFYNWVANVGRLFFSYPYEKRQTLKSYFTFIPNMFVVVFMLISLFISLIKYKQVPPEIVILLIFILIYLFGSSLVSTYRRMFYITMPFWTLYISYVFNNIISINFEEK